MNNKNNRDNISLPKPTKTSLKQIEQECGGLKSKPTPEEIEHSTAKIMFLALGLTNAIFVLMVFLTIINIISEDVLAYLFMMFTLSRLTYISKIILRVVDARNRRGN